MNKPVRIPVDQTTRELRAERTRIRVRTADRPPRCRCGAEPTTLLVGPPSRWVCRDCAQRELDELRAAVARK